MAATSTGSVTHSSAFGNTIVTTCYSATGTGSGNTTYTSSMLLFTCVASVATMSPEIMAVMLGVAASASELPDRARR